MLRFEEQIAKMTKLEYDKKKMKLDLVGSAVCNEVMKLCIGEQWLVLGGSESV